MVLHSVKISFQNKKKRHVSTLYITVMHVGGGNHLMMASSKDVGFESSGDRD